MSSGINKLKILQSLHKYGDYRSYPNMPPVCFILTNIFPLPLSNYHRRIYQFYLYPLDKDNGFITLIELEKEWASCRTCLFSKLGYSTISFVWRMVIFIRKVSIVQFLLLRNLRLEVGYWVAIVGLY